jgi:hypothetical protein
MMRLHQIVSALMILAVVTMLNAPLFACEMAGHRCAMMSHAPQAAHHESQVAKAKHDCCPRKGTEAPNAPAEKKQSCHGHSAIMPAEASASMNCCNMGSTSVVASVTPTVPGKNLMLVAMSDPPPVPLAAVQQYPGYAPPLPPPPRAVFDLKSDLRI